MSRIERLTDAARKRPVLHLAEHRASQPGRSSRSVAPSPLIAFPIRKAPNFISATVCLVFLLLSVTVTQALSQPRKRLGDPREAYDVLTYRLHFRVYPDSEIILGEVAMKARLVRSGLDSLVLDAGPRLEILSAAFQVQDSLRTAPFHKSEDRLSVALPSESGDTVRLRLRFRYKGSDGFQQAVRFSETVRGEPWVNTSCQLQGAHQWWPCKASFFHPEDKPDSIWISLTFPDSLFGVANGRYLGEETPEPGWKTTHWLLVHPRLTYLVAIYVGPYVELTQTYRDSAAGLERTLHYFVLRQDTARAKREFFPRTPEMLRCYERWFGPFAFWDEKFALVQSGIVGMEHSTAVAVGPIFPHTLKPGEPNPLSWYEEYFNYMAVHETAHEWWGNAVSALDWGEFWLHEAFATYAEALWVEHLYGPEVMHQYMAKMSFRIDSTVTVYRPRHRDAREAYHLNIYWKGAWVLHMLRYVMGDSAFFEALREFNTHPLYRYRNATSADFQSVCEEIYGGDLSWFFLPWIYRPGWPKIRVNAVPKGRQLTVDIVDTCYDRNAFRMPVDLRVETTAGTQTRRVWAVPGSTRVVLRFEHRVIRAEPVGLRWILDGPKRGTLWYFTDLDFIKGKFLNGLEFTEDRQVVVRSDSAAWESPARSLYHGARWLRLFVDTSEDKRFGQVRVRVREYRFLRSKRKPWQELGPNGEIPVELQRAGRLQYRLEFGALVGEKLPIPRVVVEYE